MTVDQPFHQDLSATASFSVLKPVDMSASVVSPDARAFRAVVIGGGTGAPMSIRSLLSLGVQTSAVVSMADDGGSTGILREEAHVTPPGDIRKCIAAFARNPDDPLVRAFKYRFAIARNHSLGNLMLAALEDACQSFPEAITICEKLLDAQGHVYPSTLTPVRLMAWTRDGYPIDGQAMASRSTTALEAVRLQAEGPITPYGPAINAIQEADLIVLGPGSLFTSIITNLLVPGVIPAIRESRGKVLFVCSLADAQGETWGLTAREYVEALMDHGMEGLIDYVLIHSTEPIGLEALSRSGFTNPLKRRRRVTAFSEEKGERQSRRIRPVSVSRRDILAIQERGPVVIARNLVDSGHPTWHSPAALREAFAGVIRLCRLP